MPKPRSNKERYNFLIDKDVYKKFSNYCEEKGLVRSKQIEILIKKLIENDI